MKIENFEKKTIFICLLLISKQNFKLKLSAKCHYTQYSNKYSTNKAITYRGPYTRPLCLVGVHEIYVHEVFDLAHNLVESKFKKDPGTTRPQRRAAPAPRRQKGPGGRCCALPELQPRRLASPSCCTFSSGP